jgi:hypothetical protein
MEFDFTKILNETVFEALNSHTNQLYNLSNKLEKIEGKFL